MNYPLKRLARGQRATWAGIHRGICLTNRTLLVLVALFALALTSISRADAATITVCAGCGQTTIQGAINAASAGDTISITDALHTEANIVINKNNLTIEGQGAANTTIDGGAAGSVFIIDSGVTATLRDMTIQDGKAGYGGGVNDGGYLTVENCVIQRNTASARGGGIYYSDGATLTATNTTFSGNSATYAGGGVASLEGGALAISGSTFSGNSAPDGGGIFLDLTFNAPNTAINSRFSDNSASLGGGIWIDDAKLTATNTTFSGNSATYAGGGIYSWVGGTVTATNTTFSGNSAGSASATAQGQGGAIYASLGSTVTANNSTFSDNKATTNGIGGGICNVQSTLTATNSIFSGNSASDGGAIYNNSIYTLTVTNSTFSDNSATYDGGGIWSYYGTLTATNSTFSGNSATHNGGGIFNLFNTRLTATNSTFSGNSAANDGGGIDSYESTATVTNSTFSGNSATDGGGIGNEAGAVAYVKSSILASQPSGSGEAGGNCYNDNTSTTQDEGYNISDDTTCGFSTSTAANGKTIGDGPNPLLDTAGLKDNGGPTLTIALQPGSPAIDAIPPADCTDQESPPVAVATDQRGVIRPQGPACDIGAYEANGDASPPKINITAPVATAYTINELVAAAYSCSDPDPDETETISCVGTVANGAHIDTLSIGTKTFTVDATDTDPSNNTSEESVKYTVDYGICALYDQTKSVHSGAAVPIKLQLCDASGANLSSSEISLHATGVILVATSASSDLENAGDSNADSDFRYDATLGGTGGYIFNLKTTGYATGTYALQFTAGTDPTVHTIEFGVE